MESDGRFLEAAVSVFFGRHRFFWNFWMLNMLPMVATVLQSVAHVTTVSGCSAASNCVFGHVSKITGIKIDLNEPWSATQWK